MFLRINWQVCFVLFFCFFFLFFFFFSVFAFDVYHLLRSYHNTGNSVPFVLRSIVDCRLKNLISIEKPLALTKLISNGNRTEWSPIRSVIIRVITK